MMIETMTRDDSEPDPERPVVRCVCFDVTFERMRDYADAHQCGLEELTAHFGCGRGCALCMPYVRRMLETGQTRFPVRLSDAEPD